MSILPHTVIQAIKEAELIQKHDRLCDLAAIDAIPVELLQLLTLNNQISIAKQSTTAERILINLATNKNKEVRLSVFKNSAITIAVLKILSEDKDRQIRRLFKVHPNNPNRRSRPSPEWLRRLAQNDKSSIRAQVARNPATPVDVLAILAEDPDYKVRVQVARNSATPIDILAVLANDVYYEDVYKDLIYKVRVAVAENPATPVNILRKLSKEPSCFCSVGRNPNTPIEILEEFVDRNNSDTSTAMTSNPSTPGHVLAKIAYIYPHEIDHKIDSIARHPNTLPETLALLSTYTGNNAARIRMSVAGNLNASPDTLVDLAADSYILRGYDCCDRFTIKIAVASNPNTPDYIIKSLWDSKDIFICQALAKNPAISTEILRNIAENNEYLIQLHLSGDYNTIKVEPISNLNNHQYLLKDITIALCRNPRTSSDILEKLADDRSCDRVSIANHQNTSIAVLEKFSQLKASSKIRKAAQTRLRSIYRELAANPETSTEQLREILYHLDIEIRLAVILHPQGLNLLLDRALQIENSLNRFIAGLHPQLSALQKDKLFYSDNWLDRLAIACNTSTSIEYLQRLSKDTHDLIRDIATSAVRSR
jgi:Leucine rich repeat variant